MSSTSKSTAERIQSWMPTDLADQLRAHALVERRSVSQVVRLAVQDSFAKNAGEGRRRPELPRSTAAAPDTSGEGRRR